MKRGSVHIQSDMQISPHPQNIGQLSGPNGDTQRKSGIVIDIKNLT
jgi:hypothetical protein